MNNGKCIEAGDTYDNEEDEHNRKREKETDDEISEEGKEASCKKDSRTCTRRKV